MKSLCARFEASKINTGLLVLRLGTGLILAFSGLMKLINIPMTAGFFTSLGLGMFWVIAVSVVEFLGGILIAVGGLTKYAAIAASVVMLVATIIVAKQDPMMASGPLTLFAASLALVFTGGGKYSVK